MKPLARSMLEITSSRFLKPFKFFSGMDKKHRHATLFLGALRDTPDDGCTPVLHRLLSIVILFCVGIVLFNSCFNFYSKTAVTSICYVMLCTFLFLSALSLSCSVTLLALLVL